MDLLLKMEKVLQLQLIHWWTPNPMKTPLFNLKMLILVRNHSRHTGRIRDTGTYGNHQTKKRIPGVPAGANRGRIRDTWTYENH